MSVYRDRLGILGLRRSAGVPVPSESLYGKGNAAPTHETEMGSFDRCWVSQPKRLKLVKAGDEMMEERGGKSYVECVIQQQQGRDEERRGEEIRKKDDNSNTLQ